MYKNSAAPTRLWYLQALLGSCTLLQKTLKLKVRVLTQEEKDLAKQVFHESLDISKIRITTVSGYQNRAFTVFGWKNTYCHMGRSFTNPKNATTSAYPEPGQLLIHELTHAWQIQHASSKIKLSLKAVVTQIKYCFGQNVYDYQNELYSWEKFNTEQQATIVDRWFAGISSAPTYQKCDETNPYFCYIQKNIRPAS